MVLDVVQETNVVQLLLTCEWRVLWRGSGGWIVGEAKIDRAGASSENEEEEETRGDSESKIVVRGYEQNKQGRG
jgi:hypothetical protein